MTLSKTHTNFGIQKLGQRQYKASFEYDTGRTAGYISPYNTDKATAITKAFDFLINDAIQNNIKPISITVKTDNVDIPSGLSDILAEWYAYDEDIISDMRFEDAVGTG